MSVVFVILLLILLGLGAFVIQMTLRFRAEQLELDRKPLNAFLLATLAAILQATLSIPIVVGLHIAILFFMGPELNYAMGGFLSLVTLVAMLVAIVQFIVGLFINRGVVRDGYCICGYDLTGNASGVCPECGRSIQQ